MELLRLGRTAGALLRHPSQIYDKISKSRAYKLLKKPLSACYASCGKSRIAHSSFAFLGLTCFVNQIGRYGGFVFMDKYKRLLNNTFVFAIAAFSSKVLIFLMMPFYTRVMPTATLPCRRVGSDV